MAWQELKQTVAQSEIAHALVSQPGQPLISGFFAPIDFARTYDYSIDINSMNDGQFKDYINANNQMCQV